MAARRGDLQRAFRRFLSRDLRKVDRDRRHGRAFGDRRRRHSDAPFQVLDDLAERAERVRRDPARRCLTGVRVRDDRVAHSACGGVANARHHASNGPQSPVERDFADADRVRLRFQLPARTEDPEGDRQIESGPLLLPLGWSEVHGDAAKRELESGVADRRANALPRLLDRLVGKTDHDEGGQPVRDIHLDGDKRGLETPERAGDHARDRARGFGPFRRGDRDSAHARSRPRTWR